jgi:hypothetical protein
MPNPLIRIHNTEIDEVIDREMTVEELKIMAERQAFIDAEKARSRSKGASQSNSRRQTGSVRFDY